MPWNRNEPDPIEDRRRQLAEQERLLAEHRRLLMEKLHPNGHGSAEAAKPAAPLVWRNEDESPVARDTEPTPARKRHLARQRQRDRLVVIGLTILFLIVVSLMIWVAYVHNTAASSGI
jgi:hypothetical protein